MIVGVCRLVANHLHLAFFESIPEVRVLPSTGITRLQRSYDPVRLPPMPPPEATLKHQARGRENRDYTLQAVADQRDAAPAQGPHWPEGWHCFAYGQLRVAARGGGGRSICAHSIYLSFLTGRAESQRWSDTS